MENETKGILLLENNSVWIDLEKKPKPKPKPKLKIKI
jgi:hypothetical protein